MDTYGASETCLISFREVLAMTSPKIKRTDSSGLQFPVMAAMAAMAGNVPGSQSHFAMFSAYMGVSIVMGDPQNRWFLLGKILVKWMGTGGTPISGNLHIGMPSGIIWLVLMTSISGLFHENCVSETWGMAFRTKQLYHCITY